MRVTLSLSDGCTVCESSKVFAFRASGDLADVRLERKLYYEFAKLKAKGRLRSVYRSQYAGTSQARVYAAAFAAGSSHSMATDPNTPTLSSVKRPASPADPASDARKRHGKRAVLQKGNLIFP